MSDMRHVSAVQGHRQAPIFVKILRKLCIRP